jgi:hypothetical protein
MKMAERKKKFKFYAPHSAPNFEDDQLLYINLESLKGCEVEIKVISVSAAEAFEKAGNSRLQNDMMEEQITSHKCKKKAYDIKELEEMWENNLENINLV